MPRVSAVMPAFDAALFIEEAIRSVLTQTFSDFELIVVDDGSTDGTAEIAERIADPRVRVVRIPHGGVCAAENAGIERAAGEYLARVDADDICLPTLFERQVSVLDAHPRTAVVGVWTRRFGLRQACERPPVDPALIRRALRRSWTLGQPTMCRTAAVRAVGGYRPTLSDDWDLWIRLAARSEIRVVPEQLALIRTHLASLTARVSVARDRLDQARMQARAMRYLGADPLSVALLLKGLATLPARALIRRRRLRGAAPLADREPTLSVIVPTFGRPVMLARCLRKVEVQDPRPDEVVVVYREDDAETAAFVTDWAAEDAVRRRAVPVHRPGQVAALVQGTRAARSQVVAYLDDDAAPLPGWVGEIRRHFLDQRVGAAGGRVLDHVDGRRVHGRARRVGRVTWYGRIVFGNHLDGDVYGRVDWLPGSNMAFRRELARFDERLLPSSSGVEMYNDVDACLGVRRAGYLVIYSPWAIVEHHTASAREGDSGSRVHFDDIFAAAANRSYLLLKHAPTWRRPIIRAYGYVVGSATLPGILRALAEVPRRPRRARAMLRRIGPAWRGRRHGAGLSRSDQVPVRRATPAEVRL